VRIVLAENVSLKGLGAPIVVGLMMLSHIAENLEVAELVITSATDGTHSTGSLHKKGAALDIRSKNLSPDQKKALLRAFKAGAEKQFDFILEDQGLSNEHFHLEHDEHA
jgi:hypothetical protein